MTNRSPNPIVPDFTPVPRKYRFDGWTVERQRAFIAALAATGSVTAAARRVGMAKEGAYQMRLQPEAASFRAAWEAALDAGVRALSDIAVERAMEGVPVPVFYKGEQCGERRWYNDRLLMFVLRHHDPERYGPPAALPRGTRHAETIAREAAKNCPVCRQRREDEAKAEALRNDPAAEPSAADKAILKSMMDNYAAKVRNERHLRLSGQIVAADFTVRQLTHIELILVEGGMSAALMDLWTTRPGPHGPEQRFACSIGKILDDARRKAWADAGEPPRPPLPQYERAPGTGLWGGADHNERDKAQRAAETRMAEAQAEWEAAARPDSWAEWKARKG
ncbi:hypothetical protein [Sphingomonas hengshuiensis]|uniref:hypothetical protein n=1 Tax=Sphingomonas hengshuiensis TaxID=1609977 RepID=UPI0006990A38|nr:hypothetical protein [Sphingomonas hengshuiensis]